MTEREFRRARGAELGEHRSLDGMLDVYFSHLSQTSR